MSRRSQDLWTRATALTILALFLGIPASGAAERLRVSAAKASLYSRASTDSFHLLSLEKGAELEVVERAGDWYSVKVLTSAVKGAVGVKGFVNRSDVEVVAAAEPAPAPVPPPAPRPAPRAAPTPRPTAPPPRPVAPPPPPVVETPPPPRPAPAPPPPEPAPVTAAVTERTRFVFLLNAGVLPAKLEFSEARTFTEFAEEGSLDVDSSYDLGFGGEIGLRYFFAEHVGAEAVFTYSQRSGPAEFTGEFPHPLFLNRPRVATGTVEDLTHKEAAVHVNVVYGGESSSGKIGYALFGGPSFFFKVESGLIGQPEYTHAFPFDTITLTEVPVLSESESKVGFNVGGEIEYRFSEKVGGALAVRYSRASVEFAVDETNTVKIDAGGFFVALGIRVRF